MTPMRCSIPLPIAGVALVRSQRENHIDEQEGHASNSDPARDGHCGDEGPHAGYPFRFSAQYFFMRALMALRSAAVFGVRRLRRVVGATSFALATCRTSRRPSAR